MTPPKSSAIDDEKADGDGFHPAICIAFCATMFKLQQDDDNDIMITGVLFFFYWRKKQNYWRWMWEIRPKPRHPVVRYVQLTVNIKSILTLEMRLN